MHSAIQWVAIQLAAVVSAGAYTYPLGRAALGRNSRSQDMEDLALYEQFFTDTVQGCFAEIGALDGSTLSNTFAYERVLNWTGAFCQCALSPLREPTSLEHRLLWSQVF